MQNLNPKYRLDVWTVGANILQLHLDSSTRLDTAVVLPVVTEACRQSRAGQVLYLVRNDAPVRPMGRTGTHLFSFVPGEDCILDAIGRLSVALEPEPATVSRRRRPRALQAVGAAMGGAA